MCTLSAAWRRDRPHFHLLTTAPSCGLFTVDSSCPGVGHWGDSQLLPLVSTKCPQWGSAFEEWSSRDKRHNCREVLEGPHVRDLWQNKGPASESCHSKCHSKGAELFTGSMRLPAQPHGWRYAPRRGPHRHGSLLYKMRTKMPQDCQGSSWHKHM